MRIHPFMLIINEDEATGVANKGLVTKASAETHYNIKHGYLEVYIS
jgi:hypothetical protein